MRGSDYAELRAFETVVEKGSFTRAAKGLGMSASGLSQTIRRLEERLDVQLLTRTTRSVTPTQTGLRLLERLRPAFAEMEAAVEESMAKDSVASGTLRINALRLGAIRLASMGLADFLSAHPKVKVEIDIEECLVDIVAGGYDAGVRLGERLEGDMVAIPLGGRQRMRVVASPDYLAEAGIPASPRDLIRHRCLNQRNPSGDGLYRWEFEDDGERLEVAVDGPLTTTDALVLADSAIAGLGIAYLFEHDVFDALDDGRLLPLLEAWTPAFSGFYLYYPRAKRYRSTLRAFIDWVKTCETP